MPYVRGGAESLLAAHRTGKPRGRGQWDWGEARGLPGSCNVCMTLDYLIPSP